MNEKRKKKQSKKKIAYRGNVFNIDVCFKKTLVKVFERPCKIMPRIYCNPQNSKVVFHCWIFSLKKKRGREGCWLVFFFLSFFLSFFCYFVVVTFIFVLALKWRGKLSASCAVFFSFFR